MLTSGRTHRQPAGGFGTASNQLRAQAGGARGLAQGAPWVQQLFYSCLGKLSQVPPAYPEHKYPKP